MIRPWERQRIVRPDTRVEGFLTATGRGLGSNRGHGRYPSCSCVAALMARRTLFLAPAAIGLILANALTITVVIGSCLIAARAAEARDRAVAALAEARESRPAEAALQAPASGPRAKRLDRMLLLGALGALGSGLCTLRIVRATTREERTAGPQTRSGAASRRRRREPVQRTLSRSWW